MTMPSNEDRRGTSGDVVRSGGRVAVRHMNGNRDTGKRDGDVEYAVAGTAALITRTKTVRNEEERNTPQLRVAPPVPVQTPRAPFIVLVLTLVAAGVMGILVLNTKINENVFRLDDLKQAQNDLDAKEEQLQVDIAQQAAPGTVAGKARELGMRVPSKPPTFIVLPDGRRLGLPQPAVGK